MPAIDRSVLSDLLGVPLDALDIEHPEGEKTENGTKKGSYEQALAHRKRSVEWLERKLISGKQGKDLDDEEWWGKDGKIWMMRNGGARTVRSG